MEFIKFDLEYIQKLRTLYENETVYGDQQIMEAVPYLLDFIEMVLAKEAPKQ